MAEEEERPAGAGAEPGEKRGGKGFPHWDNLAGWQKAGVLIGAGGLVVAIAAWWQQRGQSSSGTSTLGSVYTPPQSGATGYPGENEYYPSLPTSIGSTVNTPGGTNGAQAPIQLRQQQQNGPYQAWDATHPGIPLRAGASANGDPLAYIPFGATLTGVSNPVNGTANYGAVNSPGTGSNQWYQVNYGGKTGYVSANDV